MPDARPADLYLGNYTDISQASRAVYCSSTTQLCADVPAVAAFVQYAYITDKNRQKMLPIIASPPPPCTLAHSDLQMPIFIIFTLNP